MYWRGVLSRENKNKKTEWERFCQFYVLLCQHYSKNTKQEKQLQNSFIYALLRICYQIHPTKSYTIMCILFRDLIIIWEWDWEWGWCVLGCGLLSWFLKAVPVVLIRGDEIKWYFGFPFFDWLIYFALLLQVTLPDTWSQELIYSQSISISEFR